MNISTKNPRQIGYLYINGLGDGKVTLKYRLVRWWWRRSGRTIEHAGVNWYDSGSLRKKEMQVESVINTMLRTFDGVAIIGGSAGGSLAINVFTKMKRENVCAIAAHARVKKGDYLVLNRMSLYCRAKMDTDCPSKAFYDSVIKAETASLPMLAESDRKRILVLTQLADMVVDVNLMGIEGAQTHRSLTFGHSGGFVAHLLADRNLIARFAEAYLN